MAINLIVDNQREYLILPLLNIEGVKPLVSLTLSKDIQILIEEGEAQAEDFIRKYDDIKYKSDTKTRKNLFFEYNKIDIDNCVSSNMVYADQTSYDDDIKNIFHYIGFVRLLDPHLYSYFYLAFEKAFALQMAVEKEITDQNLLAFINGYNNIMSNSFDVFCYGSSSFIRNKEKLNQSGCSVGLRFNDSSLKEILLEDLNDNYKFFISKLKDLYQKTLVKVISKLEYLHDRKVFDAKEFNLKLLSACYLRDIKTVQGHYPSLSTIINLEDLGQGFIIGCQPTSVKFDTCMTDEAIQQLETALRLKFLAIMELDNGSMFIKLG